MRFFFEGAIEVRRKFSRQVAETVCPLSTDYRVYYKLDYSIQALLIDLVIGFSTSLLIDLVIGFSTSLLIDLIMNCSTTLLIDLIRDTILQAC